MFIHFCITRVYVYAHLPYETAHISIVAPITGALKFTEQLSDVIF